MFQFSVCVSVSWCFRLKLCTRCAFPCLRRAKYPLVLCSHFPRLPRFPTHLRRLVVQKIISQILKPTYHGGVRPHLLVSSLLVVRHDTNVRSGNKASP
ncbi:hypothetical protein CPB85DRAFT_551056 [Mucidula mucida]|nr:hypothetical protein CPB85DRAFT_551056 [Mucidula mucida]